MSLIVDCIECDDRQVVDGLCKRGFDACSCHRPSWQPCPRCRPYAALMERRKREGA